MCVSKRKRDAGLLFSVRSTIMLTKSNYTRLFLLFVIYLCISLIIVKIRHDEYLVRENGIKILRNRALILSANKFREPVENKETTKDSDEKYKLIRAPTIDLTDNDKTLGQISETCRENNLTTSVVRQNFLYSAEHNGLYCWIRKAASTSFTKIFSDMNHRMVSQNYYREIDFISPKTSTLLKHLTEDPEVFKFIAVRHPFERLVSAYRDRIEDNTRYTAQSWIYVPKIFHLTRPELFDSPGPVDTHLLEIFYEDKRLKLIPTFKEFVTWLLHQDPSKDDPHWNQYYKQCALCSVQYDYILRIDNYTRNEIDYIFSELNLEVGESDFLKLEQTKNGVTDFDVTCNYFKNLSHEAIVNLYDKYKIDFDMFNYEFDKYFECIEGD